MERQTVTDNYGMYENIKIEAVKRMVQGLQLPMAKHLRERVCWSMELSVTHFETSLNTFTVLGRF
mgnify:CR=1 FL=1